jgi:protocatechuate 4,5-dioxygenase beta chain
MMATVVGGFIMPHTPLMFTAPNAVGAERYKKISGYYSAVSTRLRELRVDTVIIAGADHYLIFGPDCLPQYLIGIGDAKGPIDRIPGLEEVALRTDQSLARHIRQSGARSGFDWAVATTLPVDHSILIPHQLCVRPAGAEIATVPVYLACGVEPCLDKQRAYALGQSVARAIAAFPEQRRVAVIGSGGISHWVGLPEMGKVNEEFDRMVLDHMVHGRAEELIAIPDSELMAAAGNGAMEIRNFLFALGVTGGTSGVIIGQEPAPEWITGLGFAELHPAH